MIQIIVDSLIAEEVNSWKENFEQKNAALQEITSQSLKEVL